MTRLLLIAFTFLLFAGCKKEDNTTGTTVNATIDYAGDIATDGFGWVLRLDAGTFEIPTNLPDEFKQDELKVNVTYKRSNQLQDF